MFRIGAFALSILLLASGAEGQIPAARSSIPVPVAAQAFASALGLHAAEGATVLLDAIRLAYIIPAAQQGQRGQTQKALQRLLALPRETTRDQAPLPLGAEVWRTTILKSDVPEDRLLAAILTDRTAALMYFGLAALDDETLQWVARNPETLSQIRRHPALFAAFGRSVRIREGRVAVPGGSEAAGLWQSLTGVDPAKSTAFVERVFSGNGRLALLYDTIAHLDVPHQRFALGLNLPPSSRVDRLRTLLRAFETSAPDWSADEKPFSKPVLDGAMLLSTMADLPTGVVAPPA
jgi:hypothetical protein